MSAQLPEQQSWLQWLRGQLASEQARHVVNVVPKDGALIVFTDSAAWSTRLRYALPGLMAEIRRRDAAMLRASVRVHPGGSGG
jgi:hypothetical protein